MISLASHSNQEWPAVLAAPRAKEWRMHEDTPVLISLNDAVKLTSMSRTFINRLRASGRFPESVSLGEKRVAFVKAEVVAWVRERIASRAKAEVGRKPARNNESRSETRG